jgi:hypothetical protein
MLGICAVTVGAKASAQSRREQLAEARNQPAGFRLAVQRIEWVDNPELQNNIRQRDYAPTISEQHRQVAQACVRDMLDFMRKGAESKVRGMLASVKALGDEHLLRLRPVGGNVFFNRNIVEWDGSGLNVEIEVLNATEQSLWKETLQVGYGLSAFSRQTSSTAEIVDVLSDRLLRRLREVDLVTWR